MLKKILLPILITLSMSLVRPLNAEIVFYTQIYENREANPEPTTAVLEMVRQAISRLAHDPRLARHPIARYLSDDNTRVYIIFDNPATRIGSITVNNNQIHISSEMDYPYYLEILAHEFTHVGIAEKYGNPGRFSFLSPEDYSFLNLMEEAFANALGLWVHLSYPEMPRDYEVRYHMRQSTFNTMGDALRNDILALYPHLNEEEIKDRVIGEMFNRSMAAASTYSLYEIPRNMAIAYGMHNTFLIPEYQAYRAHSDALLRHIWDYLASIMPFELPEHLSFDRYRRRYMQSLMDWNVYTGGRDSILYWIFFNAEDAANEILEAQQEHERFYNFLPREDEERLNRIMLEIDPEFIPVNTSTNPQRLRQEAENR